MVDKQKTNPIVAAEVATLFGKIGMGNAAISREIERLGGKATPTAVGKWPRTGQVSRKNMDILRSIATPRAEKPYPFRGPNLSVHEPTTELRVVLLRNAVNSIYRAIGAMVMVLAKTRPDEAREVLSLFEMTTPGLVDDDGISDKFRTALRNAIDATAANSTARQTKSLRTP